MKEEIAPEKELNEMRQAVYQTTEFKSLVIRMLKELSEHFNKEIVSIKKEHRNLFEKLITKNFPTLGKEIDILVLEAERVLNKRNTKSSTPGNIILKWQRLKTKS